MARQNKVIVKHRKINERSLANLKKWPEGVSGNAKGRPPAGWTWAELIHQYGDKECPSEFSSKLGLSEKPKWKEVVVAMAFRHAAKGNASILKTLVEYIDGRVPLEINFAVADKLKAEAEKHGVDWRNNPALVAIFAAEEALANRHGDYTSGSGIGQA